MFFSAGRESNQFSKGFRHLPERCDFPLNPKGIASDLESTLTVLRPLPATHDSWDGQATTTLGLYQFVTGFPRSRQSGNLGLRDGIPLGFRWDSPVERWSAVAWLPLRSETP